MKENIPKEEEKISAIRAARVSEKIRQAKIGLLARRAWWSDGPLEDVILLLVLFLNFYLVFPLIGHEAPAITFSGPVVPLLTNLLSLLIKTSFYYSLQIIYVVFFVAFPVSFYYLVKKLTNRKLIAFFACLFSTLPIYMLGRTRLMAMFFNPDGPHIVSLTITPIALYFLIDYLKGGSVKNMIFAGLSAALIALISPFGFLTYLFFAGTFTFSEVLLGQGRAKIFRFFLILILAGALSSFWYNPSFFLWMLFGPMGTEIRSMIAKLLPISLFALPILATFGYLLFDRKPSLQPLFIASFCTIAFFIITVAGGNLFPSSPARYRTELGIAVSFLAGYLFVSLTEYIKFNFIKGKLSGKFVNFLANSISPSLGVGFLLLGVIGRDLFIYNNMQVLGIWTEVRKGEIWVARGNFMGYHAYIGYAITAVALGILFYLTAKANSAPKVLQLSK